MTLTPIENNSVLHEAAGNLAYLMSVIRCGETLSKGEEANVRRVIENLKPDGLKLKDLPKEVRFVLTISRMIAKFGMDDERMRLLKKHTEAYEQKYTDDMTMNIINFLAREILPEGAAPSGNAEDNGPLAEVDAAPKPGGD